MRLFKMFLFGLLFSFSSLFASSFPAGSKCLEIGDSILDDYGIGEGFGYYIHYTGRSSLSSVDATSGQEALSICGISYGTALIVSPSNNVFFRHYNPNYPGQYWKATPVYTIGKPIPQCSATNTSFPSIASNEQILFQWQEPDNYTSTCIQNSGVVQERRQNCTAEYRCVKSDIPTPDKKCRNIPISSFVSPTDAVFHEDIALVGSDVHLHYTSSIGKNETIASGWSLNIHNTLEDNYLYLGDGSILNIGSKSSVVDGITTITNGEYSYVFDANNSHISTNNTFTKQRLYSFEYDTDKRLVSITDEFNNITTLQRDINGTVTSITAPNGQVNYIHIDDNDDLVNVTYEDDSKYIFVYENHLMTSEKEPNSNEFLHLFDTDGKITSVVDAEQGVWGFAKNTTDEYDETVVNKAAGDTITYKDYFLHNDSLLTQTITPSGDIFSRITNINGLNSNSDKCGVKTDIEYQTQIDPLTKKREPKTIKVTTPSGLSKTTEYSLNNTYNGDKLVKRETSTNINGAITLQTRDFNLSTAIITSPETRVNSVEYDEETQLPVKLQIADLEPIEYEYNEQGKVTEVEQADRKVEFTYDSRGNLAKEINLQGRTTTSYKYDKKDRVTEIVYPDGHSVEFSYDKNGNRTQLTTPTPTDYLFEYNGVNKRTSMTSPLGYKTLYMYDKQRRVTNITRASGKSILNTYEAGELKSTATPEGVTNYTYDCGSKVSSITNNQETISYTYDGDLLTGITTSGVLNQGIQTGYNSDFKTATLNYANGTANYDYDKDGLLVQSSGFTITRDPINGQAIKISDGTLELKQKYNKFGEIKSQKSKNFILKLKRKKAHIVNKTETIIKHVHNEERAEEHGKREKKHKQRAEKHEKRERKQKVTSKYRYKYDSRDRLVSVKKGKKVVENYTYDANGNRVEATVYGVTTQASYTLDDSLEVYGNNTYRYDADGYLVEKTTPQESTSYTYNTLGALTSVTTPTKTITYHLNALNQRVAKEVDGVITEKYLWANLTTLLAVYDGNDNLVQRFEYADSTMPISMTQNNQKYYLHYDQVGTLRAVSDVNHNIVKEITYDTFGNILNDTNEEFKVPFGFAGGLHDRDTGLVHFGYREYDPFTGKWSAKDPIGFNGGDSNLYGYVLGNPVEFVDSEGLFKFGIRPLAGLPFEFGPFYHENGFFENGGNVGYFPTGIGGDDKNELPNYKILPTHYNDNIMMDALNNLLNSGRWLPDSVNCKNRKHDMSCDYDLPSHNCQDFAGALRQEYRRLGGTTR